MARGKLCVNLVCKNESAVIERCLRSVMPLIDSWCIVDTGSTDDTKDIIRSVMKKLPGRLYEQKWVNFGHNKTAALRLARKHAKYALLMDADDTIVIEQEGLKLDLDAQVYNLRVRYSDLEYDRPHIVATDPDFKYVGVRHEYLHAIFRPTVADSKVSDTRSSAAARATATRSRSSSTTLRRSWTTSRRTRTTSAPPTTATSARASRTPEARP